MFFVFIEFVVCLVSFMEKAENTRFFLVFALVYTITNAQTQKTQGFVVFVYFYRKNQKHLVFLFFGHR